jgi:hypothetical protein
MTRSGTARGWMRMAAACALLGAARLPAQTVRVADLHPPRARIPAQPQKRLLLRIDAQALARYGGVTGVQFRLLRDDPLSRGLSPGTAPCVAVPTRSLRPPRMNPSTGELDFGVLFKGSDLGVAGRRWKETTFYLVAEVAGMPGGELRVRASDLGRYRGGGVLLVLQPPDAPPTATNIQQIKTRQSREGTIRPTPGPCWTVAG